MLLFVQSIQIARAMTTYENMRASHHTNGGRASEAITSALATGTLSMNGAQLGAEARGPDPVGSGGSNRHRKTDCFTQWKRILGVDTFMETALRTDRTRPRRNKNPFSRGCLQNCKDFWCDPAPIFGGRDNGTAVLDGEIINYTSMYEAPSRMTTAQRGSAEDAGVYERLAEYQEIV